MRKEVVCAQKSNPLAALYAMTPVLSALKFRRSAADTFL